MNCKRCAGKGIFTFRRVHMGVPGLCFRCDGTGREPDETLPDEYVLAAAAYWKGGVAHGIEETRLYPPKVWSDDKLVDYSLYLEAVKTKKVGDVVRAHAGAPGVGYIDSRITRIDETGVYAIEIENTMWVPEGAYFA